MSIKKIIGGICGLILGIGCLNLSNVEAEDTVPAQVIQRESWDKTFVSGERSIYSSSSNSYTYENCYAYYTFLDYVYSDNTVEIVCQCSKNENDFYSLETLSFDDSLYDIDLKTKESYWDSIISFDNNYINYIFKRKNNTQETGNLMTITLTPKTEFTEETTIEAFGKSIIINSGNKPISKGDIDSNGEVNSIDAALILQYSADKGAGNTTATIEDWYNEKIMGKMKGES